MHLKRIKKSHCNPYGVKLACLYMNQWEPYSCYAAIAYTYKKPDIIAGNPNTVYIRMDIYMCVTCSIRSKAFNVLYEKMIACNKCILNNCKNQMHAFADFLIQL